MTCDKIPFKTYPEALQGMKGLIQRQHQSCRVYKCNDCGLFHITTLKKKKLQKVYEKYKTFDMGKSFKFPKPNINMKKPIQKTIETTQKLITPLQAQILKGKIAAMNKTENKAKSA